MESTTLCWFFVVNDKSSVDISIILNEATT